MLIFIHLAIKNFNMAANATIVCFYHLGIYMTNRDCKKWFKISEITSIAKINVKVQISI